MHAVIACNISVCFNGIFTAWLLNGMWALKQLSIFRLLSKDTWEHASNLNQVNSKQNLQSFKICLYTMLLRQLSTKVILWLTHRHHNILYILTYPAIIRLFIPTEGKQLRNCSGEIRGDSLCFFSVMHICYICMHGITLFKKLTDLLAYYNKNS